MDALTEQLEMKLQEWKPEISGCATKTPVSRSRFDRQCSRDGFDPNSQIKKKAR